MPSLRLCGTYRRTVRAPLTRVWENVLDWEHLPSLHSRTFNDVQLLESQPDGWRIRVVNQPGGTERAQVLALTIDKRAGKYRVTTISGAGAGSEIRTSLAAKGPNKTAVTVRFLVPESRPARLSRIGARYRAVYKQLWDEDEAMMIGRDRALKEKRAMPKKASPPATLGKLADVRKQLPLTVPFAGARWRLVELGGKLVAHSATCPHWLGPLDDAPLEDGCVRCPWHGYRFDVLSGQSADGRGLRLAAAPKVTIRDGIVILEK